MLQRQSSQAQATRRAWAIQNGRLTDAESESDGTPPASPASSSFSDAGEAPPSPAASASSASTKAATPPRPAHTTARKNSLKASPKASSPKGKRKAACKAARPAPLRLTKSAYDTSIVLSPTSDAPQRKKEVSIRPKPPAPPVHDQEKEQMMSDEEAADTLFRLIAAAWRHHDGCSEASAAGEASDAEGSERSYHSHLAVPAPVFRGDVYYPTPGPEKSYHSFSAYQSNCWSGDEAPAFGRRDSVESVGSVSIITPPVTPVLYATTGCVTAVAEGKAYPAEAYATDRLPDHVFAQ